MAYQDFAGKRRPSSSAYTEKSSGYVTVDDPATGTGKFQIDNLIESVAPVFDSASSYTAGQSVMYHGKLYTFKVEHSGAWNASHVEATNMQDYIGHCPSITAFRTGDVIPVDGPSGTAKMSKDDFLRVTAENALAGNLAPAFDPSKPNGGDGYAYHKRELVTHLGKLYRFTSDKVQGAWNPSVVVAISADEVIKDYAQVGYEVECATDISLSFSSVSGSDPNKTATLTIGANATILFDRRYATITSGTTFSGVPYTYGGLFVVVNVYTREFVRFEVFSIAGSTVSLKTIGVGEVALPVAKWKNGELIYSCNKKQFSAIAEKKIENIFEKGVICSAENEIEISFSSITGSAPNESGTLKITKGSRIAFDRGYETLATDDTYPNAPYTYGGLFAIIDLLTKSFIEFRICGISGSNLSVLTLGANQYAVPIIKWKQGKIIYTCYDYSAAVKPVLDYWNKENIEALTAGYVRDNAYLDTGGSYSSDNGYQIASYPVKAGDKIHVKGSIDVVTRFSFTSHKSLVTSAYIVSTPYKNETATPNSFNLTLVVPDGATWFQMSQKKVNTYIVNRYALQSEQIVRYHTLHVSVSGNDTTGDGSLEKPFATIYHANEVITDAAENNRYTIKVADGTYTDLQTKYAGSTPNGYEGIVCKPWVTYEGNVEHPENVVIEWDGAYGYGAGVFDYEHYGFYKCAFHIPGSNDTYGGVGTKKVCGFTITAKNTRYAIHVESSGYGFGLEWEISDCIFNWAGVPDDPLKVNDPPSVIGTGSGHFEKGLIARCKMTNTSSDNRAFRNHDSVYRYDASKFREGANIVLDSVDFGGGAVMFRTTHGDANVDGYNRCYVRNCIGISQFTYTLSGGSTDVDWRAEVKCSKITYNKFELDGKLQ